MDRLALQKKSTRKCYVNKEKPKRLAQSNQSESDFINLCFANYGQTNSKKQGRVVSFSDWIKENNPFIIASLINEGIAFLNREAEALKVPVVNLFLDGQWHYLDKPVKKQSYRARLETDSQGIPTLFLTYYTFRHGGFSVRFNSKDALKELWVSARAGRVIKTLPKVIGQAPKEPALNTPTKDWIKDSLAQWQTMAPDGQSPYLNRKGLAFKSLPGIRFAKNYMEASPLLIE